MLKVIGKKIVKIGDLHYDDVYQGRHVSYWENVMDVTERIRAVIATEKPDLVIYMGDLIGVRRGVATLRDRNALLYLIKFLKEHPNVVVLKGNHDYGEVSDYEFLAEIGAFKSSRQINNIVELSHPNASKPVYVHCIDYGQEYEPITIQENGYNVGAVHNEFYVQGKEFAITSKGAIELTTMKNFFGLDLIASGHIHEPSALIDFNFQDGFDSAFVNLGCPTRPKHNEMYDHTWYLVLEFQEAEEGVLDLGFRLEALTLKPYNQVFRPKEDFLEELEEDDMDDFTGVQKGKLAEILGSLVTTNMGSDDFFSQIDNILVASPESKDMAKQYLRKAMNS